MTKQKIKILLLVFLITIAVDAALLFHIQTKASSPTNSYKIATYAPPTEKTTSTKQLTNYPTTNYKPTSLGNIIPQAKARVASLEPENDSYIFSAESAGEVRMAGGEDQVFWIRLRNTGNTTWSRNAFHLATSRPKDRQSIFAANTWLAPNRLAMVSEQILPGEEAEFRFIMKAPRTDGIYYEYFRPVIDGKHWLADTGIYWKITINDTNQDESKLPKYGNIVQKKIVVDISEQRLRCFEDFDEICNFPASSGTWSMPTPLGNFQVYSKSPTAYSRPYNLYMNWWMAFTPNGAYGIHELPYWKYSWGIVTEGAEHLGQRVSHGCIRVGIGPAQWLYNWAPIGTPVEVAE